MPYRPLLGLMRALGKAPMVGIFTKERLRMELRAAGFVDLQEPDVGAEKLMAFMVASRPH